MCRIAARVVHLKHDAARQGGADVDVEVDATR
jgi:hypothetical protein